MRHDLGVTYSFISAYVIFCFTPFKPDKVTKAVQKNVEFLTEKINHGISVAILISLHLCTLGAETSERAGVLCVMLCKGICMITLFYTVWGGGLPSGTIASLQRCVEQTEWRRGRRGRDYRGRCCRHRKLLPPPAPRTPGLQAAQRRHTSNKDSHTAKLISPDVREEKYNDSSVCTFAEMITLMRGSKEIIHNES